MGVQDHSRACLLDNRDMEQSFSRGLFVSLDDMAVAIDSEKLFRLNLALVHSRGCQEQTQRIVQEDAAEVSARSFSPASSMNEANEIGQFFSKPLFHPV